TAVRAAGRNVRRHASAGAAICRTTGDATRRTGVAGRDIGRKSAHGTDRYAEVADADVDALGVRRPEGDEERAARQRGRDLVQSHVPSPSEACRDGAVAVVADLRCGPRFVPAPGWRGFAN